MKFALFLPKNLNCAKDIFSNYMSSCWQIRRIDTTPEKIDACELSEKELFDILIERVENYDEPYWEGSHMTIETLKNALKNTKGYFFPIDYRPYEDKSKSYTFNINVFCIKSEHSDIPLFHYDYYFDGFVPSKICFFKANISFEDIKAKIQKVYKQLNTASKPISFREKLLFDLYENPIKNMILIFEAYSGIEAGFGWVLAVENNSMFVNIKNTFNSWGVRQDLTLEEIITLDENFLTSEKCPGYFLELKDIHDIKFS